MTLFIGISRNRAVGPLKHRLNLLQIACFRALERVQNGLKPVHKGFYFVRQESGCFENITPHMERTRSEPGYRFQSRSGKFPMFERLLGEQCGNNLRQMTDSGDEPI